MLYFIAQASTADSLLSGEVMGSGPSLSLSPIIFVLVMLLCVLAIVFIYLRRNGLQRIRKAGELDILETRPLGGRQFLLVARVGQEKFLLGICPGRIDYLCPLSSESDSLEPDFSEVIQKSTAASE
jgi:flagellar protein FliO/FliZ